MIAQPLATQRFAPAVPSTCGLYIHIPFCARKCAYCDFNTYAGLDALIPPYVDALCAELRLRAAQAADRVVTTVFVGGGTPTLLGAAELGAIMDVVRAAFALHPAAEITCEANPGTVDQARFGVLRQLGVNRLSMGAQSFQPAELQWLERIHGADDVERAYGAARDAGFDNINLDFMFGLPGQALATWSATLEHALAMAPEHLSLYSLIVEPGTPLFHRVQSGTQAPPDDDEAAGHWEHAMARLAGAGYVHYEVSNWARDDRPAPAAGVDALDPDSAWDVVPAFAARHNLTYWRNGDWVAAGAGAHGHLRARRADAGHYSYVDRRWGNVRSVAAYIASVRRGAGVGPIEAFDEELTAPTGMGETMMLGLRLVDEGVPHARFARLHGIDPRAVFGSELRELAALGLIEVDAERTRATRRGLALLDRVAERFVGVG